MAKPHEKFEGIFWVEGAGGDRLATLNLVSRLSVYGEQLISEGDLEYRVWDPYRSKIGAGIMLGLEELPVKPSSSVLYLGAAAGTTVSHVSDIVGAGGVVFSVEFSGRVARDLVERVARQRSNVVPIVEDARRPELYFSMYSLVDVVYVDLAQPDATEIALRNCEYFLKPRGHLILAVKARSIDVAKQPKDVFTDEVKKIEEAGYTVHQSLKLEPYDKDHLLVVAQLRPH